MAVAEAVALAAGKRCAGHGCGGHGGCGSGKAKNGYYSPAEWEKLSFEERDKICKERNRKGKQGGSKRSMTEMTTKQLMTAIIISSQKASERRCKRRIQAAMKLPRSQTRSHD